MLSSPQRLVAGAVSLVLFLLAGCGNAKVHPVEGTLKYKGQPVANAFVDFIPEHGRPSVGETDDQGHFKLAYDKKTEGAELGKHKVSVRAKPSATDVAPGMPGRLPKEMAAFYDKYGPEKSKQEVTIDANTSKLDLDWD